MIILIMIFILFDYWENNSIDIYLKHKRWREKMKTTLIIMVAEVGSRFGTGIKQLIKIKLFIRIERRSLNKL
ncbi:MAG: hypothetical protein ACLVH9_06180 [Fusobacterium sp.]|uniref:hypothetical protein n=1 Tax=Fusobacterium sp. TaxID=68766 RepID=UPI00399B0686